MSVGQELLDVPLPKMVADLSMGIARAQEALDQNSVKSAVMLAEEKISYVPKIVGTVKEDDGSANINVVKVDDVPLIAFLQPTFYQFSEASIEVKMDIKPNLETSTSVGVSASVKGGWGPVSASISVDVKHNRKFGKEVNGTSRLFVKMVPVPPPQGLLPEVDIKFIPKEPAGGGGGSN